jgi:hypothetical protein
MEGGRAICGSASAHLTLEITGELAYPENGSNMIQNER